MPRVGAAAADVDGVAVADTLTHYEASYAFRVCLLIHPDPKIGQP